MGSLLFEQAKSEEAKPQKERLLFDERLPGLVMLASHYLMSAC